MILCVEDRDGALYALVEPAFRKLKLKDGKKRIAVYQAGTLFNLGEKCGLRPTELFRKGREVQSCLMAGLGRAVDVAAEHIVALPSWFDRRSG